MAHERFLFLVLFMVYAVHSLCAAPLDDAVAAYENGDYSKCIAVYDSIRRTQGTSAPLLFNLGNAYVKAGDYGQAMVCFERSLLLDPSLKKAKENISYVMSKVDDNNRAEAKGKKVSVVAEDKQFFSSLKERIAFSCLPDTWAYWSGALFILTCVCVALYIFSSTVLVRKTGFFGGFILLGLSVVTLIFAFVSSSARSHPDRGVITAHKITLYAEPGANSKTIGLPLTRGTLMRVTGEETDGESDVKWYRVRLNSDYTGWINSSDFEII